MQATRAILLAAVVVVAAVALPLSAAGGLAVFGATSGADDAGAASTAVAQEDRGGNHSTEDTIGYVEGYWYDDELAVDDRDGAVVEADELEAVVYRSMARVEVIRGLTFREEVEVEVVSREAYRGEERFEDVTEADLLYENVRLEALFVADRDADALEEWETVYGDSVAGYYDPNEEQIVLVSDNGDEPEVDEAVLGHELHHALQDQHFDLRSYSRETWDGDAATDGLIEGAAVRVEEAYAERCGVEWSCATPNGAQSPPPSEFNWGLYFTLFHPYDDGPEYVEHLYEEGGWDAVDAAFDDPPASTSEVIRPGEEREPRSIAVEDRSNDEWAPLEVDGEVARDTLGEATMVSMLADGVQDRDEPSVIERDEFIEPDRNLDYDHEYTDGWAGDELVVYVGEEETVERSGYVWRTEWTSADEAAEFVEGYLELLEINGAEAVDDHRDTYVIESEYPGAYAVEHDGETVTIVRAPSVDELAEIREGTAPEGEDAIASDDAEEADGDGSDGGTDDDVVAGFGVGAALAAVLLSLLAVRART